MHQDIKPRRDKRAGIYIHVPFCERICPYCDFAVTSVRQVPHEQYADAVIQEFEHRKDALDGRTVRSIYFGGGTPSRMDATHLMRVLNHVRNLPACDAVEEITVEANPLDITPEVARIWADSGVTRVSLGCQSFQDEVLEALGRQHGGKQAREATCMLLAYGFQVTVDLIYGHRTQTHALWHRDLDTIQTLIREHGLNHVSAYHLTIEEGTRFGRLTRKGATLVQGEQESRVLVDELRAALSEVGVEPYEVSSYGRLGCESVHNSNYWMGGEYLGLGMGAHGFHIDEARGVLRTVNDVHLKEYMARPLESRTLELVSWSEHLDERLFVAMRSQFGVDVSELVHQFSLSKTQQASICERLQALTDARLLRLAHGRYSPTWEGMQVADMLGERFIGVGESD